MIKSFQHKGLRQFFETGSTRRLPKPDHAARIREILDLLDAATAPTDLDLPGYDLHRWKGATPYWSAKVSGNWRILWYWDNGAVDLDIRDPH